MKIVFFGTPRFSAEILDDLIQKGVEVLAVVTQPDKAQGRHLKTACSSVKQLIQKEYPHIPIHQPEKVRDPYFLEMISKYRVDFFVVVAFGQIFPKKLLEMPPKGCINVHTSLLPKYRGAAPIQRAIIEGEVQTGVCVMYMVEKCDAGDILGVKKVSISPQMNAEELTIELCRASKELLLPTLMKLKNDEVHPVVQDEQAVTFAKKVTPKTAYIDFNKPAKVLYNLFRGVSPRPGAWTEIKVRGKVMRLKLHQLVPSELSGQPGEILEYNSKHLLVACHEGSLRIQTLQLEGKKIMEMHEFSLGYSKADISFDISH